MEKNRIRPVNYGKSVRVSYSKQEEVLEMPNLIDIQKLSYQWFLNDGLKEVFNDISPIEDFNDSLSLEFVDFQICTDETKYSIEMQRAGRNLCSSFKSQSSSEQQRDGRNQRARYLHGRHAFDD